MTNKTKGVKLLIEDVLDSIAEPYNEDIIYEVACEIERNPDWLRRYTELRDDLGILVVNSWLGRYTKELTRLRSMREVPTPEDGHIISNYTKLGR